MRSSHSHFRCAVAVAAGGVLVALASGCDRQPPTSPGPSAQGSAPEAPAVQVTRPQKKDVRRLIERPGYNI